MPIIEIYRVGVDPANEAILRDLLALDPCLGLEPYYGERAIFYNRSVRRGSRPRRRHRATVARV